MPTAHPAIEFRSIYNRQHKTQHKRFIPGHRQYITRHG